MTAPDYAARAAEIRALRDVPARERLATAPLADILLWGVSRGHPDPVLGVLGAVRVDLDIIAAAAEVDYLTRDAALAAGSTSQTRPPCARGRRICG
jgi:hypothetical protein